MYCSFPNLDTSDKMESPSQRIMGNNMIMKGEIYSENYALLRKTLKKNNSYGIDIKIFKDLKNRLIHRSYLRESIKKLHNICNDEEQILENGQKLKFLEDPFCRKAFQAYTMKTDPRGNLQATMWLRLYDELEYLKNVKSYPIGPIIIPGYMYRRHLINGAFIFDEDLKEKISKALSKGRYDGSKATCIVEAKKIVIENILKGYKFTNFKRDISNENKKLLRILILIKKYEKRE